MELQAAIYGITRACCEDFGGNESEGHVIHVCVLVLTRLALRRLRDRALASMYV